MVACEQTRIITYEQHYNINIKRLAEGIPKVICAGGTAL